MKTIAKHLVAVLTGGVVIASGTWIAALAQPHFISCVVIAYGAGALIFFVGAILIISGGARG